MKIEFDPTKDALNLSSHGVSLAAASRFEMAEALVIEDDREDYGEDRYLAIGNIGRVLHALVFTFRGETVRVISLRRATKLERELYGAS